MHTDVATLTLVQWLSPAFPVSSFAYSHGLEAAVGAGWITDAAGLADWLRDVLHSGSGRTDAIWLRLGYDAPDHAALIARNAQAQAYSPSKERLREAQRQGGAFAMTLKQVWHIDLPDVVLPLAVGHGAKQQGMMIDAVVPFYLHAFVSNLVAGAQRLLPLGQAAGQSIINSLHHDCLAVATQTQGADLDDIFSTAFLSDIAAMTHETQTVRLFQS